jgi:uncharacterized membrane protein (Fun14 family)
MTLDENKGSCLVSLGQAFAWLVTSLLAVVDMLYVREAVLAILFALQATKSEAYHAAGGLGLDFSTGFAISLADDIMLFILGIAAVAAVVTIEYYFRRGQPKGLLLKRIGKVAAIEVGIIVISILIRAIA